METALIIFLLTVQSSYLQNVEEDAPATLGDTVQFALVKGHAWRIKTFNIDKDVHVWGLGPMSRDQFESLAHANTAKHYGDVIRKTVSLSSQDGLEGIKRELVSNQLPPLLESPRSGEFAFWVPKVGVYKSRSNPQ